MKKLLMFLLVATTATLYSQNARMKTIHDYKVKTIDGKEFDLASLKGKKVMIVNTASECGYTPQYSELEDLYKRYASRNFVIIAFPANNFGAQEPGTNEQISEFCKKNYGVTFPVMSKISVKGEDMHELYKYLTRKSENGVKDTEVKWNFQKYLVDEDGKVVDMIPFNISPKDEKVISWIKK